MNAGNQPFWEQAYKAGDSLSVFNGGKPSKDVIEIARLLPRGAAVLDLGAGEGQNALYLAEQGFETWAVDISLAGIEKLNRVASARGVVVTTEACDMRTYKYPKKFDLIICRGCLHFLSRSDWRLVLDQIHAGTTHAGFNIISVFTDTVPPPDDLRDLMVGTFHEGELFACYDGWKILDQGSHVFEDEHPGSLKHTHASNRITAQKPSR